MEAICLLFARWGGGRTLHHKREGVVTCLLPPFVRLRFEQLHSEKFVTRVNHVNRPDSLFAVASLVHYSGSLAGDGSVVVPFGKIFLRRVLQMSRLTVS